MFLVLYSPNEPFFYLPDPYLGGISFCGSEFETLLPTDMG